MKKSIFLLLTLISLQNFSFCQEESPVNQSNLKAYQNYDFLPGDKIIFEDDFTDGRDGEFPPMWKLVAGQGVINIISGKKVFVLTDGCAAIVAPRIKKEPYLGNSFTVECDYFGASDEPGLTIMMPSDAEGNVSGITAENVGNISTHYMEGINLTGTHPDAENQIAGKWRHLAIAYKDGQMKCYVDQNRVLVIPQTEYQPKFVRFAGCAPVRFTNVKIAVGSGMNMLDQIYKDGKIITHGILFDVNKASLKPQSFGVINEFVKILKQDEKIKLSIEGHTDSDGDDKSNLKLSEERARSVKNALVELGIDGARLQTKGFGESKPIDKNDSPQGKANNRRVEFIKIK